MQGAPVTLLSSLGEYGILNIYASMIQDHRKYISLLCALFPLEKGVEERVSHSGRIKFTYFLTKATLTSLKKDPSFSFCLLITPAD